MVLGYDEEIPGEPEILLEHENKIEHHSSAPYCRMALNEPIQSTELRRGVTGQYYPFSHWTTFKRHRCRWWFGKDYDPEFVDVFSENKADLGRCTLTEHVIDTSNAKPTKQTPRRVPLANDDQKVLDDLVKQGSIRPSTSPWASPIVLVWKKNGKVRPCVDYWKVNAITKKFFFYHESRIALILWLTPSTFPLWMSLQHTIRFSQDMKTYQKQYL